MTTVATSEDALLPDPRWNRIRNVIAAMPLIALVAAYFLARQHEVTLWGLDSRWLRQMMMIEFLAIHSFPFLGLLALFRPSWPEIRAVKWIVAGLLIWLYLVFAWGTGEWKGIGLLLSLTGATYLGFFLNWTPTNAIVRLCARWGVNFAAFMIAGVIADMPESVNSWAHAGDGLLMGMLYFGICAAVELSGFYQIRAWDEIGKSTSDSMVKVPSDPTSEGLSVDGVVRRGLTPILGTILLAAAPLIVGSTLTVWLSQIFEGLRSAGYALIMMPLLIAARCIQIRWVVRTLGSGTRAWWRRPRPMIFLAVTTALYLACGLWSGDRLSSRGPWVPQEAISKFIIAEMLCLLVLAPLMWWALVRQQRERASATERSLGRTVPDAGTRSAG